MDEYIIYHKINDLYNAYIYMNVVEYLSKLNNEREYLVFYNGMQLISLILSLIYSQSSFLIRLLSKNCHLDQI
jgi:hypothetical protein